VKQEWRWLLKPLQSPHLEDISYIDFLVSGVTMGNVDGPIWFANILEMNFEVGSSEYEEALIQLRDSALSGISILVD
jgi:hypothetical protein